MYAPDERARPCRPLAASLFLTSLCFGVYKPSLSSRLYRETEGERGGRVLALHRKKKDREFPVPSRDVTTKLSLGGNNDVITELFLPRGSLVSDIPAGDGKLVNHFLQCTLSAGEYTTTLIMGVTEYRVQAIFR